ncbi:MAG: YjbH domain-containing protein, partial [Acinetobacter sp.]
MLTRIATLSLLFSPVVYANTDSFSPSFPTQSDFGGVGLLQMPTARMAPEGEFSFNYMDNQEYRRWSLSMQPFDWLEATLRYTDIRTRLYSNDVNFSGDQTYKDKGLDVKARLWNESTLRPQVSVGLRDVMGTGLFDSEYVVASKRYENLDFTLGM